MTSSIDVEIVENEFQKLKEELMAEANSEDQTYYYDFITVEEYRVPCLVTFETVRLNTFFQQEMKKENYKKAFILAHKFLRLVRIYNLEVKPNPLNKKVINMKAFIEETLIICEEKLKQTIFLAHSKEKETVEEE